LRDEDRQTGRDKDRQAEIKKDRHAKTEQPVFCPGQIRANSS
jgi:hypothetical protein